MQSLIVLLPLPQLFTHNLYWQVKNKFKNVPITNMASNIFLFVYCYSIILVIWIYDTLTSCTVIVYWCSQRKGLRVDLEIRTSKNLRDCFVHSFWQNTMWLNKMWGWFSDLEPVYRRPNLNTNLGQILAFKCVLGPGHCTHCDVIHLIYLLRYGVTWFKW